MDIKIATKNELDEICKMYKTLFSDMSKLQPKYFKEAEQDKEFLKGVLNSDKAEIFIAFEKDKIAGFALVQEQETPPFNCIVQHKYAYLMDMIVEPSLRGKGTGTILMNSVKEWAKKRKLEYLELNVLSENLKAIKLYEREGYSEAMKTMRLSL